MHALLPGLSLVLSADESARFVDEIDVDIAISRSPLLQPGLDERPLLQDEWLLVADAGIAQKLGRIPQEQQHLHADWCAWKKALLPKPRRRFSWGRWRSSASAPCMTMRGWCSMPC
ncbi:LysR substrate-binding domain-containing protein [Comamonas sp. JC664]|uniref:LysR substrate-binding domain-containing protein n=1 Tax=Comamonas sp. JC664 TaxID=2801917 RepID=UPI00361C44D1